MILNKELVAARNKQQNEILSLYVEKIEALQEYIAMMTDVELPEDEEGGDLNVREN